MYKMKIYIISMYIYIYCLNTCKYMCGISTTKRKIFYSLIFPVIVLTIKIFFGQYKMLFLFWWTKTKEGAFSYT